MRRITSKIAAFAAMAMLALIAPALPAQAQQEAAAEAYFEFTDVTGSTAVFKLTDPVKIQHARDLVNGTTTDRAQVIGTITKSTAPYNPQWSFHYVPETVDFFDLAVEVCDATIPYVEEHLDEAGGAFLPDLRWCPWSSRLVREVPAP
jgi:hypothetical protein